MFIKTYFKVDLNFLRRGKMGKDRSIAVVASSGFSTTKSLCFSLKKLKYHTHTLTPTAWLKDYPACHSNQIALISDDILPLVMNHQTALPNQKRILAVLQKDMEHLDNKIIKKFDDVFFWPCNLKELYFRIEKAFTNKNGQQFNKISSYENNDLSRFNLYGNSSSFKEISFLIKKYSKFDEPLLISGETGTGKELAAKAIHSLSPRNNKPFIPINCGGIPDELFENELFGHESGAYTGATQKYKGIVEQAEGGTLFLDEVDTLTTKAQVSLLRFLQYKEYRPLGSQGLQQSNLKIMAATNTPLTHLSNSPSFRKDLLFRLRVTELSVPPLRKRGEDILLIANIIVKKLSKKYETPIKVISPESTKFLLSYSWPGNIRELENVVYRAFVMNEDKEIRIQDHHLIEPDPFNHKINEPNLYLNFREAKTNAIEQFEKSYLIHLMERAQGNVTKASTLAEKERRSLGKLLKKHGINAQNYKE